MAYALGAYKEAIGELDARGAFPLEMARHENAVNYQSFAIEPLVMVAQFAQRQGMDLYTYSDHGQSISSAIKFLGQAQSDPEIMKIYTPETQSTFSVANISFIPFYVSRFGSPALPSSLSSYLQKPFSLPRIGGDTTLLAMPEK